MMTDSKLAVHDEVICNRHKEFERMRAEPLVYALAATALLIFMLDYATSATTNTQAVFTVFFLALASVWGLCYKVRANLRKLEEQTS